MNHSLQHQDWTLQGEWSWDAMVALDYAATVPERDSSMTQRQWTMRNSSRIVTVLFAALICLPLHLFADEAAEIQVRCT